MSAARPVSPVDKLRFLSWASSTYRLRRSEQAVLVFIVENILGLRNGKPFNSKPWNGWAHAALIADKCGLSRRGVQLALRELHELELVRSWGVAGRGGYTHLHAPLLVNAASTLPKMRLARSAPDDIAVENANGGSPLAVGNANKRASKTRTPVRMSPASYPSDRLNPAEKADGDAAAGAAGAAEVMNLEDGEGQLTLPRARLLARLQGIARKGGHRVSVDIFARLDPTDVQRLLRHQRECQDGKLVGEAVKLLAAALAVKPGELGAAIAASAKPERPEAPPPSPLLLAAHPPAPPTERHPPVPPPVGPPPAASARPVPLPPFPGRLRWTGGADGGWQRHGCGAPALPEREPRPPLRLTAEHLLASGARLGIPKRAAEGRR